VETLVTAPGGIGGIAGCATGADALAECSSKKSMVRGLPSSAIEKSDCGRPGTGSPFRLLTTTSTRTWRALVRKTGTSGMSGFAEFAGAGCGG